MRAALLVLIAGIGPSIALLALLALAGLVRCATQ
jgi:hypothetical protein